MALPRLFLRVRWRRASIPSLAVGLLVDVNGVQRATGTAGFPAWFLAVPDSEATFIWPWTFDTGLDAIAPIMVANFDAGPVVVAQFEITGIAVLPLKRHEDIMQVAFTLAGYADQFEPGASEIAAARAWLPDDLPPDLQLRVDSVLSNLDLHGPRGAFLQFPGDWQSALSAVADIGGVIEIDAPNPDQVLRLMIGLNLERDDRVPIALVATLAAFFAAVASYLLFAAARARRFKLAVMRALGLSTSGVRRSIAAQATATAVVSLGVAISLGVIIGRWAWLAYARALDVLPVTIIPWATLAMVATAAIVFANLSALSLGWPATKRSPGPDLRSE